MCPFVCLSYRCTQGGGGGGGRGRVNIIPPQANFKTLVNKNAIKPEIGGPPQAICPETLDPLGILAKNIRYPLPWIFNPCASMASLSIDFSLFVCLSHYISLQLLCLSIVSVF
jgi:hypothetical protein